MKLIKNDEPVTENTNYPAYATVIMPSKQCPSLNTENLP